MSHLSKEAYMSVSWGKRTTKLDKSTILYAIANRKYVEAGEPFFLTDIVIEGMSEENIRYHLKKLTDDGVICRFESGVYYIPKINIFGEQSSLSAETVALHKDKETFKEIIEQVADDTGCAAVVIEKDYYVTMIKIPENEWEKIVLQENVW